MALSSIGILSILLLSAWITSNAFGSTFEADYHFTWGKPERRGNDSEIVVLTLTRNSGSGFSSNKPYFYGRFGTWIKTPRGFSAGIVTAFYLYSTWDKKWTEKGIDGHDEIDFEFLGNTTSGGTIIQTNWFAAGVGDHEQRHNLWFDPSENFHHYEVNWNKNEIVWFVDSIPIRKVTRRNMVGLYPTRPMYLMSSLWEASDWVTLNGLVRIDWEKEPFEAEYKEHHMVGCGFDNEDSISLFNHPCTSEENVASWDLDLSPVEERMLMNVTKLFRTYAWSRDGARWGEGMGLFNTTREYLKNITKSTDGCTAAVQMTENCSM